MNYDEMDECESKLTRLEREYRKLKKDVEALICEYEVEHFLLNGPGGIDPKEL